MTHGLASAGAEVGLEPSTSVETLAVAGRLFVELDDGRRLRATEGTVGARFGTLSGDGHVARREVEKAILALVGKDPDRPRPPRLAWEQLCAALAHEGLSPDEEELVRLPFQVELTDELLRELSDS